MFNIVARRILVSVPVVFVVTALSFGLLQFLPGNTASSLLGPQATPETIARLTKSLGLDRPVYQQYWDWLIRLCHGDLGKSLTNSESVTSIVNQRLGVSLSLLGGALVGAVVVGVLAGMWSAVRPGVPSRLLDTIVVVGLAIPAFWLALILVLFISTEAGWLPPLGYVSPGTSLREWVTHLVLPWIAMGATLAAPIAKQTRDAMSETLGAPYINSLRANGVPELRIVFRHALRNAAIPVTTVIGTLFVGGLTTAVIAEQVFGLPGLGSEVVQATTNRDIQVIQGIALYFTVIVIVVNLIVDLAYGVLNPKVRARRTEG